MTTPEPVPTPRQTAEAIHREHETLRALLGRIKSTKELPALVHLLLMLQRQLVDHFATEERPDGLHAVIAGREPRFAAALDRIIAEHDVILRDVEELLGTAQSCQSRTEALMRDVVRMAGRLHDHEARETQLFADADFIDLGGRSS